MAAFKRISDAGNLIGKTALVRVDFNVPAKDGVVTDATRISRALPAIEELSKKGAKVILLSHFGRPGGKRDEKDSLRPVATKLEELIGRKVAFADDCIGAAAATALPHRKRALSNCCAGDQVCDERKFPS